MEKNNETEMTVSRSVSPNNEDAETTVAVTPLEGVIEHKSQKTVMFSTVIKNWRNNRTDVRVPPTVDLSLALNRRSRRYGSKAATAAAVTVAANVNSSAATVIDCAGNNDGNHDSREGQDRDENGNGADDDGKNEAIDDDKDEIEYIDKDEEEENDKNEEKEKDQNEEKENDQNEEKENDENEEKVDGNEVDVITVETIENEQLNQISEPSEDAIRPHEEEDVGWCVKFLYFFRQCCFCILFNFA